MREWVCNYAAVRFLPYRETGEFVNVGVVVFCPQMDYFDFRLETKRRKRIRNFFPELDIRIFKAGLEGFATELRKHRTPFEKHLFKPAEPQAGLIQFRELVRRREALLHFSDPGVVVAADPRTLLDELFLRFVERQFAQSKEYQEKVMRDRLAAFLKEWKLKRYYRINQSLGDKDFHVRMPFVHFEDKMPRKAIKPLDLARADTTEVYDHGGTWVERMRRLKVRNQLPPQVVFTVQLPAGEKQLEAANVICEELRAINLDVVQFGEKERIHELVKVEPPLRYSDEHK